MRSHLKRTRIEQLATNFWRDSTVPLEVFPRDIEQAIMVKMPVSIVALPSLRISVVDEWFRQRRLLELTFRDDTPLHGMLVTQQDWGFIFVNASNPSDERRFTLAHEIAHYLLEHILPRHEAIVAFGEGILDVLNGLREPTIEERLHGLLNQVRLNPTLHLLDESGISGWKRQQIWEAEDEADALGLELLAPWRSLHISLRTQGASKHDANACAQQAQQLLTDHFGLPQSVARPFSRQVARRFCGRPSLAQELGF